MSIQSKFALVPLGDVVRFINGDRSANYPKGDDYVDDGVPFISAADLSVGRVEYSSVRRISDAAYERLRSGKIQRDDVLFCLRGSIGKIAYVKEREIGAIASSLVIVRATEKIDPRYLFSSLSSQAGQQAAAGLNNGAAQPNLSVGDLQKIRIPLPSVSIQRRIAGILAAYDEVIENSQRRIQILESMARALYREWFVYFRFPGYESLPIVTSPLGDIPHGWKVTKLGDLITCNRRAVKPGSQIEGRRYVPIDCLPSKSLALLEAKPIEEAQSSLQLFEKGDILFGAMRPYFHKVVVAPFAGVTRTTCFVLKSARPEWHAFATMAAFEEATVAYATAHSQGATIPYAVWDGSLSEMPLVLPAPELLERFESLVAPILSRLAQSFFVLGNLRRTRDLLLPRLLSGQIDVEAIAA